MKRTIEAVKPYYEHVRIKFKGDSKWYFLDPKALKGLQVEGTIEKKRTRTWFKKVE